MDEKAAEKLAARAKSIDDVLQRQKAADESSAKLAREMEEIELNEEDTKMAQGVLAAERATASQMAAQVVKKEPPVEEEASEIKAAEHELKTTPAWRIEDCNECQLKADKTKS